MVIKDLKNLPSKVFPKIPKYTKNTKTLAGTMLVHKLELDKKTKF
jgi:hypothetical protein